MNPVDSSPRPEQSCPAGGSSTQLKGSESRLDPLIRNNPFPFYRALREQQPVYYDPQLDVYLISRYEDVMTVLRDTVNFSLEHGYQDRYANGHVEELAEIMNRDGGGFIRDIIAVDPPAHTRLRKLLDLAFTAHRVKALEAGIRQIAEDLIKPLADRGYGDGMKDIGAPLTARIICEQLGLNFNEVGTERIARWTTALLAQIGRMQTREEMLENAREMCDLQNYIIAHIRAREAEPREDMISDLVHARLADEDNPVLSFEEKVSCVRAMLIAGNDTTAAAITNCLFILANDTALANELRGSLTDERKMRRFVEEVLRLQPPVHGLFRTTTNEVKLGDTTLPPYVQVCILFASANDDDAKFHCPRTLDLNRGNAVQHLTFGSGIHRCVGAELARMELKVAAEVILTHLDNIQLATSMDKIAYLPTLATQTIQSLPLTFSKRI
ncbi:MAG TPA: cytochrome P450 [Halioglobus sp.]